MTCSFPFHFVDYRLWINVKKYHLRESGENPREYEADFSRGRQVFRNCLLRAGSDKYLASKSSSSKTGEDLLLDISLNLISREPGEDLETSSELENEILFSGHE